MANNPYLDLWAELIEVSPREARERGLAWVIRRVFAARLAIRSVMALRALTGIGLAEAKRMESLAGSDLPERLEDSLGRGAAADAVARVAKECYVDEEAAKAFVAMLELAFWPERPQELHPLSPAHLEDYRSHFS